MVLYKPVTKEVNRQSFYTLCCPNTKIGVNSCHAKDTVKVLTNTEFGVILHRSGVNYVQRMDTYLVLIYTMKVNLRTLSKVFLHCFGVNMIAALWTLSWC